MTLKDNWDTGDTYNADDMNALVTQVNENTAVLTDTGLAGAGSPAEVRAAIGVVEHASVSHYVGDGITNEAAIAAAITAAGVNGVVDFEGVSYVTTNTVTIATAGVTLQNGGIRPTGQFTALTVTADDVTVQGMTFSRSQSAGFTDSFTARCNVVINGERFTSINCDYLGSAAAQVYLTHAACDGSVIRGGRMTGAPTFQGSAGVWAAPGSTGNQNLTIDGVHFHDMNYGVLLFNTGSSLVANCRAESLRMIPTIALTGWTLVSGTTYRQRTASGTNPGVDGINTDRLQGNTNTVYNNGAYMGEVVQGSSTPASGKATVDGGYVYINLGGTDPNTRTITGGILSGYAYMTYLLNATASIISGNRFTDNYAEDIDGLGIYLQLSTAGGAYGNQATGNHLKNVCLEGVQHPSLPFAGIGVTGGTDTLLANNTIDGAGSSGKTCPGITVTQGPNNTDPSARIIGCTVRGSFGVGYFLRSSNMIVSGCRADDGANHGFHIYDTTAEAVIDGVTLSGCVSQNNTGVGFYVDGTSAGISNMSVNIIGGASIGNANRGIQIAGSTSTTTVTRCSVIGVLVKENGSNSQQIILSGAADGITVAGCSMVHSGTSTGLYVSASVTNTVAFGNQFSISTPTNYLATVGDGTADTLVNRALTDPKINAIKDTNGNPSLTLSATASAVNYFHVENKAASGGAIGIYAMGTDANIPIAFWSKGSGATAGMAFRTLAAGVYFSATPVASGVNYLGTNSAIASAAPTLSAIGTDSNISISLVPKGTGTLQVGSNPVGVKVAVPASAGATGVVGQWAADANYIYACIATNTWVRCATDAW